MENKWLPIPGSDLVRKTGNRIAISGGGGVDR